MNSSKDKSNSTNNTPDMQRKPNRFLWGCVIIPIGLVFLIFISFFGYKYYKSYRIQDEIAEYEKQVHQEFEPLLAELTKTAQLNKAYDIDKTIRVINEIDLAVENSKDFKSFVTTISKQDYRDVPFEIMEARKEFMSILLDLYAKQFEVEDQNAVWETVSELVLSTVTAIDVGTANEEGFSAFGFNRKKIDQTLKNLKEQHNDRKKLLRDLRKAENRILESMIKYSEIYYKYFEEWDRVCVYRDRAYLAAHNQDWTAAVNSANEAIKLAPKETEAHLIKAMSLIELSREQAGLSLLDQKSELPNTLQAEARELITTYIETHPDQSAPAFLLSGVLDYLNNNWQEATLSFQQSATYYPKQSTQLESMLNPYKRRGYLRKSREGSFILSLYKAMMLGAGYFSPDLQLARMYFDTDNDETGRNKALDHFSRRRTQKQWDFVISDLYYCNDYLGMHWKQIFPEEPYLDLNAEPTMMGSKVAVEIINRSSKALHNATLILCVRFTDMHRDDYETIIAGETVPTVFANDKTDFGSTKAEVNIFDKRKTTEDIVQVRAILVADEAVSWVDTDEFKISENKELRKRRVQYSEEGDDTWLKVINMTAAAFQRQLANQSKLSINSKMGKDDVKIQLPAQLTPLRPLFRLMHGENTLAPKTNVLGNDNIELVFESVENFEDDPQNLKSIELLIDGAFRDYKLTWALGQNGKYNNPTLE